MRNANAQCAYSMVPAGALQQADKSHVSHAVIQRMQGCYSRRPTLRLADDKVAECLHARH
jgi:hypothetical protein